MDLANYCVNAVLVEGRSIRAVSAATGRSKTWVHRHVALYRDGGEQALVPKKRGPKIALNQTKPELEDAIVTISKPQADLLSVRQGQTTWSRCPAVSWEDVLLRLHQHVPCCLQAGVELLSDLLERQSLSPQPKGERTLFSRQMRSSHAQPPRSQQSVVGSPRNCADPLKPPPQTQGKVERYHQTLKKWLKKQPLCSSIAELQAGIDRFVTYYNEVRPHQARGCAPMQAWRALDKATPELDGQPILATTKVRHDVIDPTGTVTLRYRSKLHHIGVGRPHKGRRVLILMADLDVRVIAEDGAILRHFTLNPSIDYQPSGSISPEGSLVPEILKHHK